MHFSCDLVGVTDVTKNVDWKKNKSLKIHKDNLQYFPQKKKKKRPKKPEHKWKDRDREKPIKIDEKYIYKLLLIFKLLIFKDHLFFLFELFLTILI